MANYEKSVNFAAKDGLAPGNPAKIVKGSELDTEFNNIEARSADKADLASPTFTGTVTAATVNVTGTLTAGLIDGGTY